MPRRRSPPTTAIPWRRPSVAIEPRRLKRVRLLAPAQVARQPARLAQRVLAGRRVVSPGVAAFGTAAMSPSAQTPSRPSTRSSSSTGIAAAAVEREPEPRGDRVGSDAGRPDDGLGLDPAAVGQHGAAAVDGHERGARRGSRRRAARACAPRSARGCRAPARGCAAPCRPRPSGAAPPPGGDAAAAHLRSVPGARRRLRLPRSPRRRRRT